MPPNDDHEWLESLLGQPEPEIPDGGFTARVLMALPPRASRERLRLWILMGFSLVGCVLGLLLMPADSFVWESLREVATWQLTPASTACCAALLALGIWGAISAATADG